jgi:threonine/homoserine/homoserine lactone efflux protein
VSGLVAFLGVAALIVVMPGLDMALVTRNALARGRRSALATAAGVNAGVTVWIAASALGVAAVVRASEPAFLVLKLAGGAYLVLLGARTLLGARRAGEADAGEAPALLGPPSGSAWPAFRQGLLNNLLNPKMAVLFVSLLPQFAAPGPGSWLRSLLLGGLFLALGVLWLCAYALVAARAAGTLHRPAVRARIEALTGTVLLGLGLRVWLERR